MSTFLVIGLLNISGIWNVADCETMSPVQGRGTAFVIRDLRTHYSMSLTFINSRFRTLKAKKTDDKKEKVMFKNEKITINLQQKEGGLTFSSWSSEGTPLETKYMCFYKKKTT